MSRAHSCCSGFAALCPFPPSEQPPPPPPLSLCSKTLLSGIIPSHCTALSSLPQLLLPQPLLHVSHTHLLQCPTPPCSACPTQPYSAWLSLWLHATLSLRLRKASATCRPGSEEESDRAKGRSGEEGAALPTQGKVMVTGKLGDCDPAPGVGYETCREVKGAPISL